MILCIFCADYMCNVCKLIFIIWLSCVSLAEVFDWAVMRPVDDVILSSMAGNRTCNLYSIFNHIGD